MTRPTDAEIKAEALELARLLIKRGLDMAKPHSDLLTQRAEKLSDALLNEQITRDTQERISCGPTGETLDIVDADSPRIAHLILRGDPPSYTDTLTGGADAPAEEKPHRRERGLLDVPSGEETRQKAPARPWFNDPVPDLRIQNHPCTYTPKEPLEVIPEQILIRKERTPVTVVLRFQAFGISSEGDLLQGQGRNEWTLIDLSEPSEALTHDIIHALKLCPMLPTVFSLVTAENVQALFRAFAAGYNHRCGLVTDAFCREAERLNGVSAGFVTETQLRKKVDAAMQEIRHG